MSKRALTVSVLTAGLSAGLLAGALSPAAAQGNPVGGAGNVYFLSGALNADGQAQEILLFGDPGDEVYFGDWYGVGVDLPMVRRGNVYFVPDQYTPTKTNQVFVYGNVDDTVLVGDWDGDGVDTLAVRRGNQYLVKDDNLKSGKADSEFFYGEVNDTVLVGNWNGQLAGDATAGRDYDGDGKYDGKGSPAYAADIHPDDDLGYDANGNGDFNDQGDRHPGTGVDNNKDGDYDDAAQPAVLPDVPPGVKKGDTLMIQRGNEFFVKNANTTGVADYTFFFGDPGDTILVGDWATPAKGETADESAMPAQSGNGADQLAVRRGFMYYQSSELEAARAEKKNPSTVRSFGYGDPRDTVFVSSLASEQVDEFGRPVNTALPVNYADGDPMYTAGSGAPIMETTHTTWNTGDAPEQKRAANGELVYDDSAFYAEGDTMYDAEGNELGVATAEDEAAELPARDASGAPVSNGTGSGAEVNYADGDLKYNADGTPVTETAHRTWTTGDAPEQKVDDEGNVLTTAGPVGVITGDGLGVRRAAN